MEAIRYFMERGGAFTVNTGRTPATLHHHMPNLPYNAPLLMYNGSASYWDGKLQDCRLIDLPIWPTLEKIHEMFPDLHIEFQAENVNYLVDAKPEMGLLEDKMHWAWKPADWGQDMGPFIKFALCFKIFYRNGCKVHKADRLCSAKFLTNSDILVISAL